MYEGAFLFQECFTRYTGYVVFMYSASLNDTCSIFSIVIMYIVVDSILSKQYFQYIEGLDLA